MTAPTKAASAASAQYLRWRRRCLSPRLLDQRLDEGLDLLAFERPAVAEPRGACEGGRGGAETVMPASTPTLS